MYITFIYHDNQNYCWNYGQNCRGYSILFTFFLMENIIYFQINKKSENYNLD